MDFSKQLVRLKLLRPYLIRPTVNMLLNWLNVLFEGYPKHWDSSKLARLDNLIGIQTHLSNQIKLPRQPTRTRNQFTLISRALILMMIFFHLSCPSYQQNLCPKTCTCDEQNLEIICRESIGASSLPHTLNPNTKFMTLNNTQTSQFTGLDYLSKLEYLNLAFNRITTIDFNELKKNKKLNTLNTSHNMIIELKDSLLNATLLEQSLTPSMLVEQIDKLDLSYLRDNRIYITDLVVSYNSLTVIKDLTFLRWSRLKRLDLSFNLIKSLEPLCFYGLNKLEILNLQGNRLTQIPSRSLQGTTHAPLSPDVDSRSLLKVLDLSDNVFMSIGPEALTRLNSLTELNLDSCSIVNIHDQSFRGLDSLEWLTLDRNEFRELPKNALNYLTNLQVLKINSNRLNNLKARSFINLEKLQNLEMNNTTLTELEIGVFDGLDSLKRLELGYNPNLTKIEKDVFGSMTSLKYLSLFANSLTSIKDNLNDRRYSLDILDLRNNQLVCDCDLKWLTRWLRKMNETSNATRALDKSSTKNNMGPQNQFDDTKSYFTDARLMAELSNLTCMGPPALMGKLVIELMDNKLECLEPTSNTNLQLGFASLFFIVFTLIFVCMLNYCRNKKLLLHMLKENLVDNQLSVMMPYSNNFNLHPDGTKKDANLYGPEYEHIDYGNQNAAPIYSVQSNSIIYHHIQEQSSL